MRTLALTLGNWSEDGFGKVSVAKAEGAHCWEFLSFEQIVKPKVKKLPCLQLGGQISGLGLGLEKIESKVSKLLHPMSALAVFIVLLLFSVLFFALLYFAFFFLCWYFLKKVTSYKPGSGGFGDITNSEAVVGGLLSCGKPQPISAFVSDEAAA